MHVATAATLAAAGLALAATPASAAPAFTAANAAIQPGPGQPDFADTQLVTTYTEHGLAPGAQVQLTIRVAAQATYGCRAPNGRVAQDHRYASPTEDSTFATTGAAGGDGTLAGSFTASEADIAASIGEALRSGAFACPKRHQAVRLTVTYGDVAITDVTNGVTAHLPGRLTHRLSCPSHRQSRR